MEATNYIGQPVRRQDARAKVTGAAPYAGDFNVPDLAYGVVVSSPIARGKIRHIGARAVEKLPGVLRVFSHENVSGLAWFNFSYTDMDAPPGDHFRFLQTADISYSQQPVALVVAETFEQARYAASVLEIDYEVASEGPQTELRAHLAEGRKIKGSKPGFKKPEDKGDFAGAFAQAAVQHEATYYQPAQVHNPLEMFASTVVWHAGNKLTVYDKTQGVFNSLKYVAGVFRLPYADVRVVSPYVGGAFGAGLRPQPQLFMATLAALQLKRAVRVTLTRQEMFSIGHRPAAQQTLALGAAPDGTLQAISHTVSSETSRFEDYVESIATWSATLYPCPNVHLDYEVVPLDIYTPADMRGPGGTSGLYALECALDELSYKLEMDPLALRLQNYSHTDGLTGKPYSSKELHACYEQGAGRFGWRQRTPEPRSMRNEAGQLLGWGLATGIWEASFIPSRARAVLTADGKLTISSGSADIGTGTYTIMSQIAAETLGLPLADVTTKLGDTDFPLAFIEGGSATAGSLGSSVQEACLNVKEKLFKLARQLDNSPFTKTKLEDIELAEGTLRLAENPAVALLITQVLQQSGTAQLEDTSTGLPHFMEGRKFAQNVHSAVFVEVAVDEDLGVVKVTRVVSAVAAGRILNPRTARNQVVGGVVWGISMALLEDGVRDPTYGRFMNHNLAEYHIPVNADIHAIDVIFVEEHDAVVNPLGVKGVGEIGLIGVAAAVANAIYHATGRRVRELPITLDKLL
ncbi:MAG: xanthine dehydrogenase family protein molybdopterin-binding subunit [Janthinobacterium lividum]